MDFFAITGLGLVATAVGMGVSMDVSGYNLSQAGKEEYTDHAHRHSFWHAFWHGLFLAAGIGLLSVFTYAFKWLMIEYDLSWMFAWVTNIFPWIQPLDLPIWVLAIVGIGFWVKLYWDKLRGDGGDEHVPKWLKWVLDLARVPTRHLSYVLVAVDMWFLTPLLKTVVEQYPTEGKVAFVAIVFGVVYLCSLTSIKYGKKILDRSSEKLLFYWMMTLVWAEPLTTGYFVMRAMWWTITGALENSPMFFLMSGACVVLLIWNRMEIIANDKFEEAKGALADRRARTAAA